MITKKMCIWTIAGLLALTVAAQAGDISSLVFRIEATNAAGWGYKDFTAADFPLTYDAGTNSWNWSTGAWDIPENGTPGGTPIAALSSAPLGFVKDPAPTRSYFIGLGFEVASGATDTHFVIKSGWIQFPTLAASQLVSPDGGGRATAQLGVTDLNDNGVTLTGSDGLGAFRALYNEASGPALLTNLVPSVQNTTGGSGSSGTNAYPAVGTYATINDPVSDMSIMLDFSLTGGDTGSGTTTYRILPEPGTLAALALLGVAALRRR